MKKRVFGATAVVVGMLAALAAAPPAHADDWVVSSQEDSGPGSLRDLVQQANKTEGQQSISIPSGMTIRLLSEIELSGDLTIVGGGADSTTIVPAEVGFTQSEGTLSLEALAVHSDAGSEYLYEGAPYDAVFGAPMHWQDVQVSGVDWVVRLFRLDTPVSFERVTVDGAKDFVHLSAISTDLTQGGTLSIRDSDFRNMSSTVVAAYGLGFLPTAGLSFDRVSYEGTSGTSAGPSFRPAHVSSHS